MQGKENSDALTAEVTAREFDHKMPAKSWTVHDSAGLFKSEQLERSEMKESVMAIMGNVRLLLSDGKPFVCC